MLRNNLPADAHRIYVTVFRAIINTLIYANLHHAYLYMLTVRQAGVLPLAFSSLAVTRDPLAVHLNLPLAG
jgi:hypothetical protein